MGHKENFQKAVKWIGFIAGIFALILGIVHIAGSKAYVSWPREYGFISDSTNQRIWRYRLFTFMPSIFVDKWTPFVFGLFACMAHFKATKINLITKSMLNFFLFNFLMAMFGCLGYRGGLGILFGIPALLASLLALICFFVADSSADLDIGMKISAQSKKDGGLELAA